MKRRKRGIFLYLCPRGEIMKEITVKELKSLMDNNADFQLVDIREEYEYEICNLKGELIPMGDLRDQLEKISRDKKVIMHCRSGKRSASIVQSLEEDFQFTNLYNLKGGIMAWAQEIDPSMPQY